MKVLIKYIIKKSLGPFLIGLGGFIVFVSVEVLYQLSYIIVRNRVGFDKLLLLIYYYLPYFTSMGIPVGVLLAIFWTISELSEKRELMAFQVHGISLKNLLVPFLILSTILSGITYLLNDSIVPKSQVKIDEVMAKYIYKRPHVESYLVEDAVVKHDNKFIYVGEYNKKKHEMKDVVIIEHEGKIKKITSAKMALREGKYWYLIDGRFYLLNKDGLMKLDSNFKKLKLEIDRDFGRLVSAASPKKMSHSELVEIIRSIEDKKRAAKWVVELHTRYSTALAPLIIVLVGLSLSLLFNLTSKSWGVIITFILVVLYQGSGAWLSAMGKEFIIDPVLSAWIPDIIFGLSGLVIFVFIDTKIIQLLREKMGKFFLIFLILCLVSNLHAATYRIIANTTLLESKTATFLGNVTILKDGKEFIQTKKAVYYLNEDLLHLYEATTILEEGSIPSTEVIVDKDLITLFEASKGTLNLEESSVTIYTAKLITFLKDTKIYTLRNVDLEILDRERNEIDFFASFMVMDTSSSSEVKIKESTGRVHVLSPNGEVIDSKIARYDGKTAYGFKGYVITKVEGKEKKLYISGLKLIVAKGKKYTLKGGYVTTCDADSPHYYIAAEYAEIKPGKYVIARNIIFNILDFPVFYFPFFYQSLEDYPSFKFSFKLSTTYSGSSYTFSTQYSRTGLATFGISSSEDTTTYAFSIKDSIFDNPLSISHTLGDNEKTSIEVTLKKASNTKLSINSSEEEETYNLCGSFKAFSFPVKFQIYRNYSHDSVYWLIPSIYVKSTTFSYNDYHFKLSYFQHKQSLSYYLSKDGDLFQNLHKIESNGSTSFSLTKSLIKTIGNKVILSTKYSYYFPFEDFSENNWKNHFSSKLFLFSKSLQTDLIKTKTSEYLEYSRYDDNEQNWYEQITSSHSSSFSLTLLNIFQTSVGYIRKASFYRDKENPTFEKTSITHLANFSAGFSIPLGLLIFTNTIKTSYDFLNEEKPWDYPLISTEETLKYKDWKFSFISSTRYYYDSEQPWQSMDISLEQTYKIVRFKNSIKFTYKFNEEYPIEEIIDSFTTKSLKIFEREFDISGLGKLKLNLDTPKLYYVYVKGTIKKGSVKDTLSLKYTESLYSDEKLFTLSYTSKGGDPYYTFRVNMEYSENIWRFPYVSFSITKELHKWIFSASLAFSIEETLRFSQFTISFKLGDFPDKYFKYDAIEDSIDFGVM